MAQNGLVFAAAIRLFGKKLIWVDESFKGFDPNTQKFILEHEVGHILNGDLDKPRKEIRKMHADRLEASINETPTVHITEIKADKAAVEAVGYANALKALTEIKDELWIFSCPCPELDLRIEAINQSYLAKDN